MKRYAMIQFDQLSDHQPVLVLEKEELEKRKIARKIKEMTDELNFFYRELLVNPHNDYARQKYKKILNELYSLRKIN